MSLHKPHKLAPLVALKRAIQHYDVWRNPAPAAVFHYGYRDFTIQPTADNHPDDPLWRAYTSSALWHRQIAALHYAQYVKHSDYLARCAWCWSDEQRQITGFLLSTEAFNLPYRSPPQPTDRQNRPSDLAWAKQQLTWLWQHVFPEQLIPPVIVIPSRSIWSINDWCCAQSDHPLGRLIADLQQGQWRRREQAVRLLGGLNDHRAVRILLKVIQADSSQTVRTAAGEALLSYGTEAAGALVQALDSEYTWDEPAYRAELEAILIHLGASAVGPLIDALTHRDWRMRDTAAELLGLIGAPQAIKPLSALLEQEHSGAVQQRVKDALRRIRGTA